MVLSAAMLAAASFPPQGAATPPGVNSGDDIDQLGAVELYSGTLHLTSDGSSTGTAGGVITYIAGGISLAGNSVTTGTADQQGPISNSTGNVAISDTFTVSGTSALTGTLDVQTAIENTMASAVVIAEDLSVTGTLTVTGNVTSGNITASDDLQGGEIINNGGTLWFNTGDGSKTGPGLARGGDTTDTILLTGDLKATGTIGVGGSQVILAGDSTHLEIRGDGGFHVRNAADSDWKAGAMQSLTLFSTDSNFPIKIISTTQKLSTNSGWKYIWSTNATDAGNTTAAELSYTVGTDSVDVVEANLTVAKKLTVSGSLLYRVASEVVTGANAITAAESGTRFNDALGSVSTKIQTLPDLTATTTDGLTFWFDTTVSRGTLGVQPFDTDDAITFSGGLMDGGSLLVVGADSSFGVYSQGTLWIKCQELNGPFTTETRP